LNPPLSGIPGQTCESLENITTLVRIAKSIAANSKELNG
jgi:hypothetical protein